MDDFKVEPCTKASIKKIINGLNEYNLSRVKALADNWTPLEFTAKNSDEIIICGILSGIGYWNGLEIKVLWVDEEYRNKGIGTRLLKHVEKLAIQKGATIAMLDTFDFQAEHFYLKNGYESFGEIKDFPKGHRRIFFSKNLA